MLNCYELFKPDFSNIKTSTHYNSKDHQLLEVAFKYIVYIFLKIKSEDSPSEYNYLDKIDKDLFSIFFLYIECFNKNINKKFLKNNDLISLLKLNRKNQTDKNYYTLINLTADFFFKFKKEGYVLKNINLERIIRLSALKLNLLSFEFENKIEFYIKDLKKIIQKYLIIK